MTGFRGTRWALPVLIGVFPVGCRESEPPPRYYQDLGTEERPLLPTSTTWNDPRLLPGQSEWHPFREPTLDSESAPSAAAPASPEGAPVGAELEAEIRGVIEEHNERLAAGEFAELGEFYHADQAETVPKLAVAMGSYSAKLKELGDHLPDEQARIERLAEFLNPKRFLNIEIARIESAGANEVLVEIVVPWGLVLTTESVDGQSVTGMRCTLGEDGYWYIKSPVVAEFAALLPVWEAGTAQMDAQIAIAKAGGPEAATVRETIVKMLEMFEAKIKGD